MAVMSPDGDAAVGGLAAPGIMAGIEEVPAMSHPPTRRAFLLRVAGGAALLPAAGALARASSLPADEVASERYWNMVRGQFAFPDERVPMNAANLCPSLRAVAERVSELTRDIDLDCSFPARVKFGTLLEESRRKVAAYLHAHVDEVALVRNTSEANNTINNGLPLTPGDEVVIWDQNHPTNNVAWDVRAARFGVVVKRVATPARPEGAEPLVKVFTDAFTPRTRVLAITHVSNVSGIRLPVKELCAAARARGLYSHVDGAQTAGALHVDLKDMGCDSYSASLHKWLCGPKEAGILYVRAERVPEIWPNVVAPGWGSQVQPEPKGARKFESFGQRDDACLAAVGTAIDFHDLIGRDRVEARVMELATALKRGLRSAGFPLVTPMEPALSGGVCTIELPAKTRVKVVDALYQEHGIAGSTSGGLRLCPHVYNTMEHVERAVRGVAALKPLMA